MPYIRIRKRRTPAKSRQPTRARSASRRSPEAGDLLAAGATLVLGGAISAFLFLQNPYLGNFETYHLVNCAVLLFIPLLAIVLFLRQSPVHFGLSRGDRRLGLKWTLFCYLGMVPILIFAATRRDFVSYYGQTLSQPLGFAAPYAFSGQLVPHLYPLGLLYYELGMGFYLFCWEFFFRGFLLFGLARFFGAGRIAPRAMPLRPQAAWYFLRWFVPIVLQAIPFTLLHWSLVPAASKPPLEIASAFFGGLLLGVLAWRTRSFVYGFLIHWAISATLDLLLVARFSL